MLNDSSFYNDVEEVIKAGGLSDDELKELHILLKQYDEYKKFNKSEFFIPYKWQEKFYQAGKEFHYRFLSAGNRVGKTFSQAFEFNLHLTGLYPDWWKGRRFDKPVNAWALGITTDSTRDVLQKELLGTNNAKDSSSIGSGSIARKHINFDTIERDGGRVLRIQIKHYNGSGKFDGYSSLTFKTSMMDEAALMGAKLDLVWMDEQPPFNEEQLHSQLVMRVSDSGGTLTVTATPEQGATALLSDYRDNSGDGKYYQQAGWRDCLSSADNPHGHLSEEWIALQSKNIPSWQLAMRMNGEPILGSGAVYDSVNFDDLVCDPIPVPNSWRQICGVDIGFAHDTAAIWSAHDPITDTIYVTGEHVLAKATPLIHTNTLNSAGRSWIPVVLPRDAHQTEKGSGVDLITYYKEAGANVLPETFYNAHKNDGSRSNSVETGITEIRERMLTGRFKIFSTCPQLLKQLRSYYRDQGKIVKDGDDICDAMRYSAMSVVTRGRTKNTVDNGATTSFKGW